MYRKETFASHTANDAVHLYNRRFRIICEILLKVRVAPTDAAAPVNLEFRLFISWTVFDLTGQVNVSDIKKLGIHIVIQRLFAAHQFIHMLQIDLMKGLPVFDQGTDNPIDSCYVIFVGQNAGPCF